jgi:hypothetical protein
MCMRQAKDVMVPEIRPRATILARSNKHNFN